MSEHIISKLAQVRRKQAMVFCVTGVSLIIGLIVIVFAVEMLVDWGVRWPWSDVTGLAWTVRAVILAILLAGVATLFFQRVLGPWIFGPDDEELALAVEREESDLRGRLIAAVQLSRPQAVAAGASPGLVRALVNETENMVVDRDFDRIIRTEALYRFGSLALIFLICGGIAFAMTAPASGTLLRRALLSTEPVPRKTTVDVITKNLRIPKGESVTIIAVAKGVKPKSGIIEIIYPGSSYSFPIEPDPDNKNQYSRTIENVTTSFKYAVKLNDGRSDDYTISAVDRPAAASIDCLQIFPAYIHHPDVHHLPGDLSILAGSRLLITVRSNKPLQQTSPRQFPFNHVHLAGVDKDYPLALNGSDQMTAVSQDVDGERGIPILTGATGLSIQLVDPDNITTKDPTVYHVDLVADKPPTIRITSNQEHEAMVTRVAVPHITFDAYDDYALGSVSLHYTVNGGPEVVLPIALNPPNPQSTSGSYDFNIGQISLPAGAKALEGATIAYWLHAEDQNTVSNPNHQPGMADTDHYQLKVVTEDEKRRELMGRVGIIPDQLNPITDDQKQSSESLGNLIMKGTGDHAPTTQPGKK